MDAVAGSATTAAATASEATSVPAEVPGADRGRKVATNPVAPRPAAKAVASPAVAASKVVRSASPMRPAAMDAGAKRAVKDAERDVSRVRKPARSRESRGSRASRGRHASRVLPAPTSSVRTIHRSPAARQCRAARRRPHPPMAKGHVAAAVGVDAEANVAIARNAVTVPSARIARRARPA